MAESTDARAQFRAKTDDEILDAALEIDTYSADGQEAIREEIGRRPGLVERAADLRKQGAHESMVASSRQRLEAENARERFPGFVLGIFLSALLTAIVLQGLDAFGGVPVSVGGVLRSIVLFAALGAAVLTVFDTTMTPKHYWRFAFALLAVSVMSMILTRSPGLGGAIGAIAAMLWFWPFGWLGSRVLAAPARRVAWLRVLLVRLWPELSGIRWG